MGAWEDGFASGYEAGLTAGMRGTDYAAAKGVKPRRRASKRKAKVTRKPSAYNRFMKREMKSLRKKHPRMKQPQIMKKAARAWRAKKRRK